MDFETVWYELLPFVYGIGGVLAIALSGHSKLLKVSGVLLIVVSLAVLRARRTYRRATYERLPSATDATPPGPTLES